MKVHFIGANSGNVTGSKYILEVNDKKVMLDCGLYQGHRKEADEMNRKLLFNPEEIDVLVLSHAHMDHSGNIPYMVKNGFRGKIYCTHATKDLCGYMLLDSAYIQEREVEYMNEKREKNGMEIIEPLYTSEEAEDALTLFEGLDYDTEYEIVPGVTLTFKDAGHILGSAISQLEIDDNGEKKCLVYSGDLGRKGLAILRDPVQIEKADYLIIESTYGDRYHESVYDIRPKFEKIIKEVCKKGGKLLIPAFSLERTQEVVYHLHILWKENKVPKIPIFVDSPLAGNVTEVFKRHPECYDEDVCDVFQCENDEDPFGFEQLKYTKDVEESKKLNTITGPCVIISAAGMCEHGRILHHLKNNVENPSTTILIVGYMAEYTLGRKIFEKNKYVRIFGQPYKLAADVQVIDAFSGHADKSDLLDFIDHVKGLKKIFLVHGEIDQQLALKAALKENNIDNVSLPEIGDVEEL